MRDRPDGAGRWCPSLVSSLNHCCSSTCTRTLVLGIDDSSGQDRHSPRCWGSLPPRFTSRDTLLPHCLISSMASACVMSLVDLPLISISWSPTWNKWFTILCSCRTILCNSQNKERHVVELPATTDAEAKASCASLQLHAVVLPILSCLTLRLHHHHNTGRGKYEAYTRENNDLQLFC